MTTARNALAKGSTPEFVQEITGLDMAVIEQLAGSNGTTTLYLAHLASQGTLALCNS
ncbi:MAG: hypothetical protein LBI28_03065 [Treponema sp.]|jgi:hypothetical protein|nr:hypothetical protein [Treponema sp.]